MCGNTLFGWLLQSMCGITYIHCDIYCGTAGQCGAYPPSGRRWGETEGKEVKEREREKKNAIPLVHCYTLCVCVCVLLAFRRPTNVDCCHGLSWNVNKAHQSLHHSNDLSLKASNTQALPTTGDWLHTLLCCNSKGGGHSEYWKGGMGLPSCRGNPVPARKHANNHALFPVYQCVVGLYAELYLLPPRLWSKVYNWTMLSYYIVIFSSGTGVGR